MLAPTIDNFARLAQADPELARQLLRSPSMWSTVITDDEGTASLTITDGDDDGRGLAEGMRALEPGEADRIRAAMDRDGYARIPDLVDPIRCHAMARAIVSLCRRGWEAAFVLVFDEPWIAARRMGQLMHDTINEHLVFDGEMFAFCVDPSLLAGRDRGVPPHRDRGQSGFDVVDGQRRPRHCTCWLALTEAEPSNGCMYLVPAGREGEAYYAGAPVQGEHPDAVAEPAEPGTALLWGGQTLHWGGRFDPSRAAGPRVALACSATHGAHVRGAAEPASGGVVVSRSIPSLAQRLALLQHILRFLYPPEPGSPLHAVLGLLDSPSP